jgi:hypothetical protein
VVGADQEFTAAGAGGGRLRASDRDRDRVLDMLKTAFVHGRLTKDELDVRAGQALTARTWADLTALTADIPAWPIQRPARRPARARSGPPARAVVRAAVCAVVALAAVAVAGMPGIWTLPVPASVTAQACQAYFGWQGAPADRIFALDAAATMAGRGSDPRLAADLQALLAAVERSEVASGSARNTAGHQARADMARVQSDCLAANRPPAP